MCYSLHNIKVYTFFLAYIITTSLSKSVKYPIKNDGKISSFVFDYQSNLATVEWVDHTTMEMEMKQTTGDDCIYMGSFPDEKDSIVLMTGCDDEIKNIQIESSIHGYTIATCKINGTVMNDIMPQMKVDKIANKRRIFSNDIEDDEKLFTDGVILPKELILNLEIFQTPSWRKKEGKEKGKMTPRILKHVEMMFQDKTLDVKMKIDKITFGQLDDSTNPPSTPELSADDQDDQHFLYLLSKKKKLSKDTVYVVLTDNTGEQGYIGSAPGGVGTICDQNPAKVAATVSYFASIIDTAQTFTHEIGHVLGMYHDFDKANSGRTDTCGPPASSGGPDNYLMNYDTPMQSMWSPCSNEDFHNHYKQVISKTKEAFCLKSSSTKFSTSVTASTSSTSTSISSSVSISSPRKETSTITEEHECKAITDSNICAMAYDDDDCDDGEFFDWFNFDPLKIKVTITDCQSALFWPIS